MDRLRRRADFVAAARGPKASAAAFTVQCRPRDDDGPPRIGLTVSRKVGTATERNRVRRRLREVVKQLGPGSMRRSNDYVLVGRRVALTRDFQLLLDDLRHALRRVEKTIRAAPTPPTD
jgi:ribonuclease P protein component